MLDKADIIAALRPPCGASSDFDLHPTTSVAFKQVKTAAVLVPLCLRDGILRVMLTKRAAHLAVHPGQIAFPGGRAEQTDKDPAHTALREAQEETGLPPKQVTILGALGQHQTVTGYQVHPVVGWITQNWQIKADKQEVEDIFFVPLAHFLNLNNFQITARQWQGHKRRYYIAPYGPYYIWGATARILYGFAQRLAS